MLTVRIKVTGGRPSVIKAVAGATIQTVINEAGHGNDGWTINMNGRPANLETEVTDNALVTLADRVKGGQVLGITSLQTLK